MASYDYYREHLSHARDGHSRPLANNTRVESRGENIAIRLHSTDVVTIRPDGSKRLATGGWYTVTTLQRVREYGSRHVVSDHGDWSVWSRPRANDPRPEWPHCEIPRPFYASDLGPEPVDRRVGCIAGTREEFVCEEHEAVYEWQANDPWLYVTREDIGETYSHRVAHVASISAIVWGRSSNNYRWGEDHADYIELSPNETYKQCPHCAEFRARHRRWDVAMHGGGYGRSRTLGYVAMCELIDRFGDRKGWQDAYITEFRQVREARREFRAWERRNLIPWHLGCEVDADGYACEASARTWRHELVLIEKEERRRARVHAFVERETKKLLAKRERQAKRDRALRREIAANMAAALANDLEWRRSQAPQPYREMTASVV